MHALDPFAVPSAWIRRFAHLVPKSGLVLDLAAGGGRHARFFAGRGHPVLAVDRNLAGMADLTGAALISLVSADLEVAGGWSPEPGRYAAIIVTHYLYRPLLPVLAPALSPGGILLYETFAQGQEQFGRPSNPDYLLRPNELLQAFAGDLTVIGYEHGIDHAPRPVAVQRLAAISGRDLVPL